MGRWTHDDDVREHAPRAWSTAPIQTAQDASRLPEGFRRTAYDADTGRYYFRDAHGQLWAGPAGSRFGELKPGACAACVCLPRAHSLPDWDSVCRRCA
jgi:hypothetical protein